LLPAQVMRDESSKGTHHCWGGRFLALLFDVSGVRSRICSRHGDNKLACANHTTLLGQHPLHVRRMGRRAVSEWVSDGRALQAEDPNIGGEPTAATAPSRTHTVLPKCLCRMFWREWWVTRHRLVPQLDARRAKTASKMPHRASEILQSARAR
jgi:hypothetical protein